MNLLVGSTGFVGGHVVEYLFQQGEISKGAFRRGSHLKTMDLNGVQAVEVDLADHHTLHEAVEGCDTVYSMASPTPYGDTDFVNANTAGILNLLEAAQEQKVKNFIHLSCLEVYGFATREIEDSTIPSPANDYQKSKLEAERLLLEFAKRNPETRIVILRPAKAIGSRDTTFVAPLLRMIKEGKVSVPRTGIMSFTHPRDIAMAMYKSATSTTPSGRVYLIKSFDTTPGLLAKGIADATGSHAEVRTEGLLRKADLPNYTREQLRAQLSIRQQASWSEIGFAPAFGVAETSEEIANWYRKDPWAAAGS